MQLLWHVSFRAPSQVDCFISSHMGQTQFQPNEWSFICCSPALNQNKESFQFPIKAKRCETRKNGIADETSWWTHAHLINSMRVAVCGCSYQSFHPVSALRLYLRSDSCESAAINCLKFHYACPFTWRLPSTSTDDGEVEWRKSSQEGEAKTKARMIIQFTRKSNQNEAMLYD